MVVFQDIESARKRIDEYILKTSLEPSFHLSKEDLDVHLKLECHQKTRSFKIRGALSKLTNLDEEKRSLGVMTVSSGNHGVAVSYASGLLPDIKKAEIFVPKNTPQTKIDKMRYYGADVKIVGKNYDEAHKIALDYLEQNNVTFVDPCSDREVIAGQGTIGIEIMEKLPEVDTVLVPVGGGGLITGISVAIKNLSTNVEVMGLQTEACPAMIKSLEDNKLYDEFPSEPSICGSLIGGVGKIPYEMAQKCIDSVMKVKEKDIKRAVRTLMMNEKIIAEPSASIGVAAVMSKKSLFENEKVAIVVSGGNIKKEIIRKILCKESFLE